MNRVFNLALLAAVSLTPVAQQSSKPVTNADVLSMTKSGIGEQTIVLAIQQGPTNFDTSPQALVELKKDGVTDSVLDAMLAASSKAPNAAPAAATTADAEGTKLLGRALNAIGPREKLTSIRVIRYVGTYVQSNPGGAVSSELERVTVYPDRFYMSTRSSTGVLSKLVLTPGFNYTTTGKMTSGIPTANLQSLRELMQFDPAYIAQHPDEFTCSYEGTEHTGAAAVDKLRIRNHGGREVVWNIDSAGRILRITTKGNSGESVTELSDYRLVDGVYISFNRHTVENGHTTDITIRQYEINPTLDQALFASPAQQPVAGLRIKVLQQQSVPYVQETGGGISASCHISGSAFTSMTATTTGNFTSGNATTTSDLHMNCNSFDTTIRWPHVLNAMLVEASDGNAYIIACDRAWRWSKCVPLKAGQNFNARSTSKGMVVQAFNTKGHETEPTYMVLQSKVLH